MPRIPAWIFALILLVHIPALFVDVMDIDASQYAEMAREMGSSHNWTFLYDRGAAYLDKPPMLFWLSAASMKVFGPTNFGFKFPSFLAAILAVYATYRLGRRLRGETVGRLAALVLASCQGMFLMTNDVRTDTMLMGWAATAFWGWAEYRDSKKWKWLLLTAAAVAFGMMTKGPIALLAPVFAFGADALLRRDWKQILDPRYLVAALVIVVLLVPMSIGLYQQFDADPNVFVNGKVGASGLRFFYWSQSFGRITGESHWNNGAGLDFLFVNMLWAFLPWILLFVLALGVQFRDLFRKKFRLGPGEEGVALGGFVLSYLALGMSRYQLPHYIFVVFPLAALLVAVLIKDFADGRFPKWRQAFSKIQTAVGGLLLVGVFLILTLVFPAPWWAFVVWATAVFLWLWVVRSTVATGRIVWGSTAAILLVNLFLTTAFYRPLMRDYQLGSQAGRFIQKNHIPGEQVMAYRVADPLNSLPFYARNIIHTLSDSGHAAQKRFAFVLTGREGLEEMHREGIFPDTLAHFNRFKVSELTPGFLSAKSRPNALTPYWLVRMPDTN